MSPDKDKQQRDERRDPNTEPAAPEPEAHPIRTAVGTVVGAVAGLGPGAAIGAAIGTAAGGPIGTAVGGLAGAAVGAVAGGMGGEVVTEGIIHPDAEAAYWREHHKHQPYHDPTQAYQDYEGAYRVGYEGYARLGQSGRSFEECEPELQRDYECNCGNSGLSWEDARPAVRAAWERVAQPAEPPADSANEETGGTRILHPKTPTPAQQMHEREEQPRSFRRHEE